MVEACGLSPYFGSAFWRYLTEDWVDDQVPNRGLRVTRLKRLPYERFVKYGMERVVTFLDLKCAFASHITHRSWTALIERHPDDETGFVFALLKGTRPGLATLSGESFEAVVEDVVLNHRELNFLHGNTVFQRLYIETVITRIFYTAARTLPPLEEDAASGKAKGLSYAQFRKSGFVDILKNLGDSEINDVCGWRMALLFGA